MKNIVITGGSSGIGFELTKLLFDEGFNVVAVSRNITKNKDLKKLGGKNLFLIDADLSVQSEIEKVYEVTKKNLGKIDVLVNNAGRGVYAPIEQETPEQIRKIIDLNLFGLIYLTNIFSGDIIESKGTIVNIASVAGRKGFAGLSTYCATKWGVVGFSESLRDELCAKGVRVITVEPGLVDTNWGEKLPDAFINYKKSVDMLTPTDVANTILFAIKQPPHVSLNEILIRPTNQPR